MLDVQSYPHHRRSTRQNYGRSIHEGCHVTFRNALQQAAWHLGTAFQKLRPRTQKRGESNQDDTRISLQQSRRRRPVPEGRRMAMEFSCIRTVRMSFKRATKKLRRSTEQARDLRKSGCILGYEAIDSLCKELDATEKKQMTDYIINLYSVINFSSTTSFYGNYSKMSRAFESNTGSEYDIAESYENHSGPSYRKMSQYASKDICSLLCQPIESREKYLAELLRNCQVKRLHAMKFLHIDSEETR